MKPYLIFIFLMMQMIAVAQEKKQQKPIKTINQKFSYQVQNKSSRESNDICNLLNLNNEISFVRVDTIDNYRKTKKTDNIKYGIEHQRYVQYLKGYKIEDSDLRVHKIGNTIIQVNGHITNLDNVDTKIKINRNEASSKAIEYIKSEYPEQTLKIINKDKSNETELVLTSNLFDEDDPVLHLTYKVLVENQNPKICIFVYVDAIDGKIVNLENTIMNVQGLAQTRYSGSRQIETTFSDTDSCYILYGSFANIVSISTMNMLNIYDNYYNMINFTDNDNQWMRNEFQNSSLDDAALDVHWGMTKTCEYFLNVHDRISYNGYGGGLLSGVHNGEEIKTYYSSYYQLFAFADGIIDAYPNSPDYDAMVSLDIVAHEFGHGINAYTAKLVDYLEAGAIQEGLSDIWAVCVENYIAPEKQKWLIGENVLLTVANCLRDLKNPKNRFLPDTYGGTYWINTIGCTPRVRVNDNCGIHENCGVMSRWFYLLAEGGSGVNDLQNNYTVSGIGIDKAAQIVYLAETNYITKYATYNSVRDNMISAATDIFGECSPEVISVINAWHAVGVGGKSNLTLSNKTISQDTTINACSLEINNINLINGATLEIHTPNGVNFSGDNYFEIGTQLIIN